MSSTGKNESHNSMEGIPVAGVVMEEGLSESAVGGYGHVIATEDKGSALMECPVCLVEKSKDCFLEISTCHHRCCSKCLQEYFRIEIMESRLAIACPECSELFHPNDIRAIVQDNALMQKYEDFMLRRVLAMDSDTRWCPAPDCGFAVIATGCAGCPKLKCEREGCDTYFCYHCKQYWHPNQTCDAARAERSPNIRSASVSYSQESGAQNEIKSCPRCGAFIVKMDDGSCNHMTCAVCGAGFCWLCMKEISDLHYLSPSGCTFWGRKPWSRKKKILWQLGTLVGAPVGITLVAGVAVPAMIIGIPVWIGRKIHFRYHSASKHRRNLAVTGGVAASILAAPIIAGLAVGIGVPILLAYVYGVVPFSLCRSGGCGVTTTNTGGVRFEFDEHDENNTQGPYSYAGDNHSIETAPNVANPSIAPSIGDASLGMTNSLSASGSHMDRVGVLRDDSDRDSSSHRAIAGNSINGSLCSATYTSQHHKLEVQADISEHAVHCERSSVGGESYSMSLNDDASTKALAGSIISPKDKDGISLCSRHFDGATSSMACSEDAKKDDECLSSSSGGGGQQKGSSSCPTSPHLRKASPAPSEDARSNRGKKCTRFMDQVSEIESRSDCLSIGSIASNCSTTSPTCEGVCTTVPAYSTLSLTTTTTTTHATLASCESLMSEGKVDTMGSVDMGQQFTLSSCGRVKAESTSVLMDGADSRRCEMGGARRKSDSTSRDDLNPSERSFAYRKRGVSAGEKEHCSQPGNLSDISEMKGMPALHAAGCSDLLAVIDTSCENVFLDKTGQTKSCLVSASSSCSSSDDPADSLAARGFGLSDRAILEPCTTLEEDENLELSSLACSLSDVKMLERKTDEVVGKQALPRRKTSAPSVSAAKDHPPLADARKVKKSKSKLGKRAHWSSFSQDTVKSDSEPEQPSLCKRDSCVSRTSIGSDPSMGSSPLPDVEMPLSCPENSDKPASGSLLVSNSNAVSSSHPSTKPSEPVLTISSQIHSLGSYKAPLPLTSSSIATAVTSPALTNEKLPPGVRSISHLSPINMSASPSQNSHQTSASLLPYKGTNYKDAPSMRTRLSLGTDQAQKVSTEHSVSPAFASKHPSEPTRSVKDQNITVEKQPGCLYTEL